MPKSTRTPERMEIGGGFNLKQLDNGNYTLHWADGERFNGAHVLSPQEAAALQSPAPINNVQWSQHDKPDDFSPSPDTGSSPFHYTPVCTAAEAATELFARAIRGGPCKLDLELATSIIQSVMDKNTALQSPAGEWRDISTAPKNGDEILVARLYDDGGALMEVACWYVASWAKRSTESLAIATQGKVSMILLVGEEAPTHWMPLPPAPTGEV